MTRPLLFAMLYFLALPAADCQKIEKYYNVYRRDTNAANARFYSLTERTDSGWRRREYYLHNLTLQMEGLFEDSLCTIPSGHFRYFHSSRMLQAMGAFVKGRKQGLWVRYYSDGVMEDSTWYDHDRAAGISQGWYRNGYPRDSCRFGPDGSGVELGWFDNGMPSYAGRYGAGRVKTGRWVYLYKSGGTAEEDSYDGQGRLMLRKYFNERGVLLRDTLVVNTAVAFAGGVAAWDRYLDRSLYLPEKTILGNGDLPVVIIDAVIDEEGRVADAEVAVPFYPAYDKIALDVVRHSAPWSPAIDHNRRVRSVVQRVIKFRH